MKLIIFFLFLICANAGYGQELGYTIGLSKEGINAEKFQPLYGFTFGKTFNKYVGLESYFIYSQRTIESRTQADYISFILMPKVGYFDKTFGIYYAPGLALNPTLHHSNIENHTYLSTIQSVGAQVNVTPKIIVDIKGGYDIGLAKAYLISTSYQKYKGAIVLASMKFDLNSTANK